MSGKLGYALIGCGGCGVGKHLTSYAKLKDDVDLVGVYDIVPEKATAAAEKFGVGKVYNSLEELLADSGVDTVSVATTNLTHTPIAVAALDAGKHVHVEKPMAIDTAAARTIVDAEARSGKKVLVGLNNRFTEAAVYAKSFIETGSLGEVYHARCGWRRRVGFPVFGTWFGHREESGGGPLIDLGVHFVDLTMHMLGYPAPAAVSAMAYDKIAGAPLGSAANHRFLGRDKAKGGYDVEDIAVGFIRLTGGATISFEFSWASHTREEVNFMEILGSKGGLEIRNSKLTLFSELGREPVDITPLLREDTPWGEAETRHFIDCIENDKPTLSTPAEAVKMMQIIGATYESALSKREVTI